MSDEETVVESVVDAPEIEQEQTQAEPEANAQESESNPTPKRSKEDNTVRMRKSMEELKRQNEELQRALINLSPKPPAPVQEPDEFADLADEDFVSFSQVKKYAHRAVQEAVKSALRETKLESNEDRFRAKYQDYDAIVNSDNFETLFEEMPELRSVLKLSYDAAKRGEDVDPVAVSYKLLKKFQPEEKQVSKKAPENYQLSRNEQKPKAAASIKSQALHEAYKFVANPSKSERERIYKETVEASKASR